MKRYYRRRHIRLNPKKSRAESLLNNTLETEDILLEQIKELEDLILDNKILLVKTANSAEFVFFIPKQNCSGMSRAQISKYLQDLVDKWKIENHYTTTRNDVDDISDLYLDISKDYLWWTMLELVTDNLHPTVLNKMFTIYF